MITCDRCEITILYDERVLVPTKQDPYGEKTDWCTTCAEGLNSALAEVRKNAALALRRSLGNVIRRWGIHE